MMKKDSRDADMAMLAHRTTPLGPQLPSPAELVFGRKIGNILPIATSGPSDDQFRTYREKGYDRMTHKHQCEHPELHLNQPVYYQDVAKKTWPPGNIIGVGPEPRSYTVEDEQTGRPLRRNRQLLRSRIGANKIAPPLPEVVEPRDRIGNNKTGDILQSARSPVQPPALLPVQTQTPLHALVEPPAVTSVPTPVPKPVPTPRKKVPTPAPRSPIMTRSRNNVFRPVYHVGAELLIHS